MHTVFSRSSLGMFSMVDFVEVIQNTNTELKMIFNHSGTEARIVYYATTMSSDLIFRHDRDSFYVSLDKVSSMKVKICHTRYPVRVGRTITVDVYHCVKMNITSIKIYQPMIRDSFCSFAQNTYGSIGVQVPCRIHIVALGNQLTRINMMSCYWIQDHEN